MLPATTPQPGHVQGAGRCLVNPATPFLASAHSLCSPPKPCRNPTRPSPSQGSKTSAKSKRILEMFSGLPAKGSRDTLAEPKKGAPPRTLCPSSPACEGSIFQQFCFLLAFQASLSPARADDQFGASGMDQGKIHLPQPSFLLEPWHPPGSAPLSNCSR